MPKSNTLRTPEYIKLKHSINSCTNADQLQQLSKSVIDYHKSKNDGAEELLDIYIEKEYRLSPETASEELSIES